MKRLGIFLISLSFIACQNEKKLANNAGSTGTDVQASKLSFNYDSVKVYSKHSTSGSEKVRDTSKAVIVYPVFSDQKINQFIEQKVMNAANDNRHYATYKDLAAGFIKDFEDFTAEDKTYAQTWFLDIKTEVTVQQSDYLSMLLTYVSFAGGAHPNSSFTYLNYNPITQHEILLDSLIKPETLPQLTAIGEKIFRKNEKLTPAASLQDNYFFKDNKFSLNQNFTITKKGLKFLYNPYEIKAYVFGTTELVIPFSELKDVAKPNSLLNPTN